MLHPSGMRNNLCTAFPATGQRRPTWYITSGLPVRPGAIAITSYKADLSESKITTPVLGWRQGSVIRSDSPDFGVAESFSTFADIWIVW